MDKNKFSKVFGIGLNKTGTSSLGICLKKLGFSHHSCRRDILIDCRKGNFRKLFANIAKYDSFDDWPYPLYYKLIDMHFPNSKFILTTRLNNKVWLESLKKHSLRSNPYKNCRSLAYGYRYPHQNEKYHLDFYEKHNSEVTNYFKNRECDFLSVCWEKGDGYEKICDFLGRDLIKENFPHENKSRSDVQNAHYYKKNISILKKLGLN